MQRTPQYIWLNGKFVAFKGAKIHLLNHSLHYGSGVFEGIRAYETPKGSAVFRLNEHVARLFRSSDVMGMKLPYSQAEVTNAILATVKKNKSSECYIRPLCFYDEKMGLDPTDSPVNVMIATWPWGKYLTKEAVKVKISDFARIHPNSSVMEAKISGHYSNSILASMQVKKQGYDEALLLDHKGNIAEGPGENVFFVFNNTLYTPKLGSILAGITRDTIIQLAKDLGLKVVEKNIKPAEIGKYKEAFFTGTAAEVNAIGQIDKHVFSNNKEGEVTAKIRQCYLDTVHGKLTTHKGWLSLV